MFEGLTNKGREYMAKCLAENKPITFVKVKIGNGSLADDDDPESFTDVKSLKKEVDIAEKTQVEDAVRILIQIDNAGLEEGYFPREIGIYVQDGEQEILYWYINDGTETSWLPPASKSPVKFKYYINLMATNLETVIVNWTGKELWVDREFLNKELAKKQDLTENRLLTKAKKIWEGINELFNTKLEKGDYTGTAKNLNDEISKKASKTQLGRVIVGDGLNVDKNARLSVAQHTHTATEIVEDSTHRTVTDGEKASWNGKFDRGVVPASLNNAEKVIAALKGNGGLKFDDTLLYLNDAGTKKVGYMYLDKLTEGIFECIGQTTTTVNNSSYFRNISNKENSDRLENLTKLEEKFYNNNDLANPGITFSINDNNKFIYIVVNSFLSCDLGRKTYDQHYIFSIEVLKKTKTLYQHIYGYGNSSTTSLESMRITIENNTISISWASGTTDDNSVKYVGMI